MRDRQAVIIILLIAQVACLEEVMRKGRKPARKGDSSERHNGAHWMHCIFPYCSSVPLYVGRVPRGMQGSTNHSIIVALPPGANPNRSR